MKSINSGIVFLLLHRKISAGIFLFFGGIFCSLQSFGQSYFYFENKIPQPNGPSLSYYSFLTLQPDGSAVARIRSGNYPLAEQPMADSVFANNINVGELKYLVPSGEPIINGAGNESHIKLRFIFKKQVDSTDIYYLPFRTEYADNDGIWKVAETVTSQEKSYTDLLQQKDFVRIFYNEDDAFYNFLYSERERANNIIARQEKLYLIVVANTNDPKIGVTSKKDFDDVSQTFTTLAKNLGMKIIATKIMGNDFNKQNLDLALANLKKQKPSPIDIVIFYYSGHGFRYSNDVSRYPRMSLRSNPDQDLNKNNMEMEEVYNQIVKLGARVNIVLSDCCNQDIGVPVPVGKDILKTRFGGFNTTSQSLNMANCNALFFSKEPISIIASSAEIKQLATGNPALGGFFTYYFKALLDKSLYSFGDSKSWLKILLDTKEKARWQALSAECGSGRCVQLAEIKVDPPR
ncbi:MAG: caspase family protein [Ginsengibacter sp.]